MARTPTSSDGRKGKTPSPNSTRSRQSARSTGAASVDDIGSRLLEIRQSKGLRVTELARAVGVTPSLISQIERGQSRPSVATLFALARALDVPVDAFFEHDPKTTTGPPTRTTAAPPASQPGAGRYLVRRADRATLDVGGGVRWERLTPSSLDGLEFLELVYGPHAESNPELYRHPGIELVAVLEGRLDISIGFERYELAAGDSLAFPSSLPHRYANPLDTVSRAITVIVRDDLSTLRPI